MQIVIRVIENLLKVIISLFVFFIAIFCLYTFTVTDILKKDYVNIFGYTYFIVATGSMEDTINIDDLIIVKVTKDIKKNDIITYKNENGLMITHRIIDTDDDKLITKGDANNIADSPIDISQVVGRVEVITSPVIFFKIFAVCLIVFFLCTLLNFEKLFKKYVFRKHNVLPDNIFSSNGKYDEASSGMTVTIPIIDIETINKKNEELTFVEYLEDTNMINISKNIENELVDTILSILRCKTNNLERIRINKKWLNKYQYIYKLSLLVQNNKTKEFVSEVANPSFNEIYDYDLDKAGLTEVIRNKIYEMPVYVILRLLVYTILYNDDELFDGIYKILKYKSHFNYEFNIIKKSDSGLDKITTLIEFMKNISLKYDNKNVFDLDSIEDSINN